MTTHRKIEFTTSDGIVIRGNEAGPDTAPPVLLIHGGGQTRESWRSTAEMLAKRDWRAIYIDLRGHGDSDWPSDGDYQSNTVGRDIIDIVEQLDARPAVVGASMGGLAALTAVKITQRRLFSNLVLVDVAPQINPQGVQRIVGFMTANPDGFASMDEVLKAVSAYNPHREYTVEGLKKNVRLNQEGRFIWHWDPRLLTGEYSADVRKQHFEDAAHQVALLKIPTLLVRGQQSDLLTVEGAQHFLNLVPHAEYVDVDGAGHMVVGDRNDLFSDALIRFLAAANPLSE